MRTVLGENVVTCEMAVTVMLENYYKSDEENEPEE